MLKEIVSSMNTKAIALGLGLLGLVSCMLGSDLRQAVGQEKQEPHKLVKFHLVLLKRGPNWSQIESDETKRLHEAHTTYIKSLLESGKAAIAGPLADDGDLRGVLILRTDSESDANTWAGADPAVSSGHLLVEMHPWWAEDIARKPVSPLAMATTYLAFLVKGPKWSAERTPASEDLQRAHMANIMKLAEMKKLVWAGPFGDNGTLRGIFVFRVASLDEAKELAATDPAVRAEHLALEIYQWQVPEGILP
jgi:uncharacterized protein